MFLKSMELSGFKSFADKTILHFEQGIIGIVGPNGCGKSNINDAIRWVLGEQSAKSLRSGSSMSDIIFSGSESRKPVNIARVSLVFDNTAKVFNSPYDEIEITREIRRNGDSNCFLNKTPCRLKDISELVMDTGLGRDSLSIISQGNISSFADARPEERRLLFEEAAGVAKYKKRKKVSLSRLENMTENLNRVQDVLDSYQEQIESLQQQAQKAKEYIQLTEELSSIEISVLVIQIDEFKQKLGKIGEDLKDLQAKLAVDSSECSIKEEASENLRNEIFELDTRISKYQSDYTALMEESYALQRRKDQLDEKRKYAIETSDAKAKAASLNALLAEARFEYEDRKKRYGQMLQKLDDQNRQVQAAKARLEKAGREIHSNTDTIQSLNGQKMNLENRMQTRLSYGVSSVLKARNLNGIEGLVKNLITCEPEYAAAFSSALGGAVENIITRTDKDAREAIEYLRRTRGGRATFLSVNIIKSRFLPDYQLQTLSQIPGILGVLSDFAICAKPYENIKNSLLATTALAENLNAASNAAKKLNQKVRIVTLDGDMIHAGGAMSGGSMKNNAASNAKDLKNLEAAIQAAKAKAALLEQNRIQAQKDLENQQNIQIQIRIDLEKLDNVMQAKKEKMDSLALELQDLNENSLDQLPQADSLVVELSALHEKMDALTSDLKICRQSRQDKSEQNQTIEGELRELRRSISSASADIHTKELEQTRLETKAEEALERLGSSYQLTYEAARVQKKDVDVKSSVSRIRSLKSSISKLGTVNLKAPEQLEEIEAKFKTLSDKKAELESASNTLLQAIDEMDQTMITQFTEMFDKINEQLDGVFKAMFGGGHARLSMVNPQDVLETGIDIDVQPPGKMVKNIQTFSGGEKALIAISVLFAILKARTIPLCIFDEVEAALDQANVERFAKYLQHFKDQSQFIVVTHRPGTMEECDTLYGVTMQKDGVSQVLKVLLKEAASYVQNQ